MHVGMSRFYNNMFEAWALQTPVTINMHDEAIRMERPCLVVVQHKHSIGKVSSWPGAFEWTVLGNGINK